MARSSRYGVTTHKPVRSILLFHNPAKEKEYSAAEAVRQALVKLGIKVVMASGKMSARAAGHFDLALAVGGDGTMLAAARVAAPLGLALLGVKSGFLGFLTAVESDEFLKKGAVALLDGRFEVEPRMLLEVTVKRSGRTVMGPTLALNDCVIRAGREARAILVKAHWGTSYLADYFGDGLIVATPTGSTAYALAAQGPIVEPSLGALVLTPICPHTLAQRPLVLPTSRAVALTLGRRHETDTPQVFVSLDGQITAALKVHDQVHIRRYPKPLHLYGDPRRPYFEVLRQKLRWGGA